MRASKAHVTDTRTLRWDDGRCHGNLTACRPFGNVTCIDKHSFLHGKPRATLYRALSPISSI